MELEHFEIPENYAVYRPTGEVTLERAVEMVKDAITFAREHHIRNLLVNASNLTGYEPPDIVRGTFTSMNGREPPPRTFASP
jgi:hypothetical protein